MLKTIIRRLFQKSTATGAGAVSAVLGMYFAPGQIDLLIMVATSLYGTYKTVVDSDQF